jgi:phosphohistidine phosphatase
MDRFLLLLRHAKSDWNAPYNHDHDRPLANRGEKAARLVGRFLSEIGMAPQSALTSSAVRARATVELAAEAGNWDCPIRVCEGLYQASPEAVLAEIGREPESTETLLAVGHEPTWSRLASRVAGGGQLRYPTAALVCVRFDLASWVEVTDAIGELLWFVTPKLLQRAGVAE